MKKMLVIYFVMVMAIMFIGSYKDLAPKAQTVFLGGGFLFLFIWFLYCLNSQGVLKMAKDYLKEESLSNYEVLHHKYLLNQMSLSLTDSAFFNSEIIKSLSGFIREFNDSRYALWGAALHGENFESIKSLEEHFGKEIVSLPVSGIDTSKVCPIEFISRKIKGKFEKGESINHLLKIMNWLIEKGSTYDEPSLDFLPSEIRGLFKPPSKN